MKTKQALLATTHIDLQLDKLTLQALEGMARQVSQQYLPLTVEHDIRWPPIGRIVSAEVVELDDGEYGLLATLEEFEDTDSLDALAGDGRRIPLREQEVQTIAVEYDRSFRDPDGSVLLNELSQISGEGEQPTEALKKSLEPVATLVIGVGVLAVGSIATGFLSKLGADLYERLRDALIRYYRKKRSAEQVLNFRFTVRDSDRALEVHVLIINPSEQELGQLFASKYEGVDALLLSLPVAKSDIAKLVLEWKDGRVLLRYAVRGDGVPLVPPQVGEA